MSVVVSRVPNVEATIETQLVPPHKQLYVSSYEGFVDRTNLVERDQFTLNVEFLTILNNDVKRQTKVTVFDLKNNLLTTKEYQPDGPEQSASEQIVLEAGRLTKKIRTTLNINRVGAEFILEKDKLVCSDIYSVDKPYFSLAEETSQPDLPSLEQEVPSPEQHQETFNAGETEKFVVYIKNFLEHFRTPEYNSSIDIILRSLEEHPSKEALGKAILQCKQIIDGWKE